MNAKDKEEENNMQPLVLQGLSELSKKSNGFRRKKSTTINGNLRKRTRSGAEEEFSYEVDRKSYCSH